MTPTAGHQFDVSSVDESCLVAGFTANGDLLGLVEGHLAPHLRGFTSLTEADIGPDAQQLWLWCQRLPHRCLVVTPAAAHEISGLNRFNCRSGVKRSQSRCTEFESKINECVWSAPWCSLCDSSVVV